MPVLATITVASLLFGGSYEKASLLSPASLQPKLRDILDDASPQLQATAIALVPHGCTVPVSAPLSTSQVRNEPSM